MQRLARDGLVVLQPHRGAFVRRLDPAEVSDLFEVRITLERKVARLAAQRPPPPRPVSRSRRRRPGPRRSDPDAQFRGPHDLHAVLAEASANPALAAHVARSTASCCCCGPVRPGPVRAEHAIDEHAELIAAVPARPGRRGRGDGGPPAQALTHALSAMEG